MTTSDLEYQASSAADQAGAYIAALFAALGSREPFEVLREMPDALRQATAGLSPQQLSTPERAGKWSVRQVVQHLADSELVGGFRFRMILAHDRPSLPGYDQDLWAERLHYQEADLETALGDFTALRSANLRVLERATPADLERALHHEERGDESLGHLLRMHAGHDVVHLRQIARIRAAIGAPLAAG
jgi:uncharacterized damage-inducible protein DinB